jgi:uncharacterized cupin superfamily protein
MTTNLVSAFDRVRADEAVLALVARPRSRTPLGCRTREHTRRGKLVGVGTEVVMARPILNIDELEFRGKTHGERYAARIATIGSRLGAQKLGYNLTVLPPGKRAFPLHCHRVNEEMFFVVAGEGELRVGHAQYPLRSGDVIACPPGGPDTAHQIVNTSIDSELRYLAVSTRLSPDLAEYPDSGKFALLGEFPGTEGDQPKLFRFVGRQHASLDYWDGE